MREAWVSAEREVGEALAVRRRQAGKAWRRHPQGLVDPVIENFTPAEDPTLDPHSEKALDLTGTFVRKHNGGVTKRKDHATIANPTLFKDEVERQQGERRLKAKAPVVDDIDLAEARLSPDAVGVEAVDGVAFDVEDKYLVGYDFDIETGSDIPVTLDPEIVTALQNGDCFECEEKVVYVADQAAATTDVVDPDAPFGEVVVDIDEIDALTAAGMHVVNDRGFTVIEGTRILDRKLQDEKLAAWEQAFDYNAQK